MVTLVQKVKDKLACSLSMEAGFLVYNYDCC